MGTMRRPMMRPGREQERPGVVVVGFAGEMLLDRIVGQIAGGDDVRQQRAAFAADAQALGQMRFDESCDGVRRVCRNGLSALTAPAPFVQRLPTPPARVTTATRPSASACMPSVAMAGIEFIRHGIFDVAGDRQAILRETNAAGMQIGLDLLVLHAIEPVGFEQCFERQRRGPSAPVLRARQQVVEEIVHHAGEIVRGAAGGGEAFELGAASGGEVARFGTQKRGHGKRVVAGGHQGVFAAEQRGLRAAFIDGEIVDHRLHGERARNVPWRAWFRS